MWLRCEEPLNLGERIEGEFVALPTTHVALDALVCEEGLKYR